MASGRDIQEIRSYMVNSGQAGFLIPVFTFPSLLEVTQQNLQVAQLRLQAATSNLELQKFYHKEEVDKLVLDINHLQSLLDGMYIRLESSEKLVEYKEQEINNLNQTKREVEAAAEVLKEVVQRQKDMMAKKDLSTVSKVAEQAVELQWVRDENCELRNNNESLMSELVALKKELAVKNNELAISEGLETRVKLLQTERNELDAKNKALQDEVGVLRKSQVQVAGVSVGFFDKSNEYKKAALDAGTNLSSKTFS